MGDTCCRRGFKAVTIDDLEDIQEIKRLKAAYFRCIDAKEWRELEALFAENAEIRGPENGEPVLRGNAAIVELVKEFVANATTVHCGQMPEIELLTATKARGLWTMFDFADYGDRGWVGAGHYEDEYVRINGRWKIRSLRLTRERLDWWECGAGGRTP